jgi:hypothetical protein
MNHLAKMTPEQREAAQRKRKEQADYYKSLDTRQDFADESYWRELAAKHKVKLPVYYFPADIKRVRKFLRKLGYSQSEFEDITGGSLKELVDNNPNWPSWALSSVCMELLQLD